MSYNEEYLARLKSYIQSEIYTRTLYRQLASKCHGETAALLRRMGADEDRHLKAMQMEYYLLTGDTMPIVKPEINGSLQENLRLAYAGEWGAAEGYAREAVKSEDLQLQKLYLEQSRDELRHRRALKCLLGKMFGG